MKKFSQKVFGQIRQVVFGVEDGLISTLGVLTGIAGGSNNRAIIILSGIVIVLVEALSMGAGTYLSSKSERQAQEKILREELDEIRKNPQAEKKELISFYKKRGYHDDEIKKMVRHVMKDEKLLLEEMAHKELGIVMGQYEKPLKNSVYMFFSYIIGGIVPVLPYFFLPVGYGIIFSIILACLSLFILGYYKGQLTETNKSKSGLEMLVIGAAVSAVAYLIGLLIGNIIGLLK